jgi:hypothetical protein
MSIVICLQLLELVPVVSVSRVSDETFAVGERHSRTSPHSDYAQATSGRLFRICANRNNCVMLEGNQITCLLSVSGKASHQSHDDFAQATSDRLVCVFAHVD